MSSKCTNIKRSEIKMKKFPIVAGNTNKWYLANCVYTIVNCIWNKPKRFFLLKTNVLYCRYISVVRRIKMTNKLAREQRDTSVHSVQMIKSFGSIHTHFECKLRWRCREVRISVCDWMPRDWKTSSFHVDKCVNK